MALLPPPKILPTFGSAGSMAIPPGGKRIVFVGQTADCKLLVFVGTLDQEEAQAAAGLLI